MSDDHEYVGFRDVIDETDYGLIVDKDGYLKGLWMPKGQEEAEVPATISRLCIEYFGFDPNDEDGGNFTVH